MGNELYRLICFFVVYSFFGWCAEVIYATVTVGRFVNRGFLNGPVCPIYGFGVISVLYLLSGVSDVGLLFVSAVFITSFLEFLSGFILEKVFNQKWWDYSNEPFNIKGYICVKASLGWGILCLLVVYVIQPLVAGAVDLLPQNVGQILLIPILLTFITDLTLTIVSLCRFKHKIRIMADIEDSIKAVSDTIGKGISDTTTAAINMGEKSKAELDKLKQSFSELEQKRIWGQKRIFKAFPLLGGKSLQSFIDDIKSKRH